MTAPPAPRDPRAAPPPAIALPCICLFFAMLNLTLVVPGLKELVVDELGGTVADTALFFTVEMVAYLLFAEVPTIWTWLGGAVIFGSTAYITHREIKAAADVAAGAAAEEARATS